MNWGIVPPFADGLWYATAIARMEPDPKKWAPLIDAVPETTPNRGACRQYLADQFRIMRNHDSYLREKTTRPAGGRREKNRR